MLEQEKLPKFCYFKAMPITDLKTPELRLFRSTGNKFISGASHIYDTIYADDVTGQEEQVELFSSRIWCYIENLKEGKNLPDQITNGVGKLSVEPSGDQSNRLAVFDKPFAFIGADYRPINNENSFVQPADLKVPAKPKTFLSLNFCHLPNQPQGDNVYFGMASEMKYLKVLSIEKLSGPGSTKTSLLVTIEGEFDYQPGDSFSTVLPNDPDIVDRLLKRLKVGHLANVPVERSTIAGSSKSESAFSYIPKISTLRYIFAYCLDIASMPFKKAFFRMLADYASEESEYEQLLKLSSRQGAEEYNKLRERMLTLLDILNMFKSCNPPVERLVENLQLLLPRPYSFASSPLCDKNTFSFVFNVVNIPEGDNRKGRQGVATGWFERHWRDVIEQSYDVMIPAFLRSNTSFRMPDDPKLPLVLIGPGTGVAPFVGFMKHRQALLQRDPTSEFGNVHLLFGCRTKENDFLFEKELELLKKEDIITELLVSFSRDEDSQYKYVQDILKDNFEKFGDLIMNQKAHVYICGDAKNMAKDVNEALIEVIEKFKNISNMEARGIMVKLRSDPKQVKEDVWT